MHHLHYLMFTIIYRAPENFTKLTSDIACECKPCHKVKASQMIVTLEHPAMQLLNLLKF